MNDAIKSAIRKLLDMGEQAQDGKLMKLAEAKRAPPRARVRGLRDVAWRGNV